MRYATHYDVGFRTALRGIPLNWTGFGVGTDRSRGWHRATELVRRASDLAQQELDPLDADDLEAMGLHLNGEDFAEVLDQL